MNERVKTKDRVFFSREKKEKILHKSKGVCAHCGKELDLETMTVDHVIPLSKGGTNELKNLVALCEDCNQGKRNYVVEPEDFFKYLDWVYTRDLSKLYKEYSETIDWVSKRQILSEDLHYSSTFSGMGVYLHKGKCMVKAIYSDLDDIYRAYIKFHDRKANFRYDKEEREMLKLFIQLVFTEGCFYIHRNSCGDVALVVPVIISLIKSSKDEGRFTPMLFMPKILLVYKKRELSSLLLGFLTELFMSGLKWNKVEDISVPLTISAFGDNSELHTLLDYLKKSSVSEDSMLFVSNEVGDYLSTSVFTGDLRSLMESGKDISDIDENVIKERVNLLVNFFKDLGVLVIDWDFATYFLTRDVFGV